jgi:hypothetical protein
MEKTRGRMGKTKERIPFSKARMQKHVMKMAFQSPRMQKTREFFPFFLEFFPFSL